DILRTGNASTTTAPWFLAMVVLVLWRKSLRAFATRRCRRATRRIALRRLRLPRFLCDRLRCALRSARNAFLPWLAGAIMEPSLNVANAAIPRSMPTAGSADGVGAVISRSHWTAANHCPAGREIVTLRILPGISRQLRSRSRIQPSLGSLMRPDDLPVRLTASDTGSGKRKLSLMPLRRGVGGHVRPSHQFR